MKIGFIGAGKVGCTLGRYFVMHGIEVLGYYDRDCEALKYAEELTGCSQYTSVSSIVRDSDILFITVTDGVISKVWEEVKLLDYRIQSVGAGRDALAQVFVKMKYQGIDSSGRGLAQDVLEASAKAYLNAVNRVVYLRDRDRVTV